MVDQGSPAREGVAMGLAAIALACRGMTWEQNPALGLRTKNAIQGADRPVVSASGRIRLKRPISFYASGRGFVIRCDLANIVSPVPR
jgi:hypothetical protein